MTSRDTTGLLSLPEEREAGHDSSFSDVAYRLVFGAIGWPWLLFSLWGGTQKSKRALMERVALPEGALPNLGSWKADTGFLHRIVDAVEELQPRVVVELGAGATTLVCARAMERNGQGRLISFDQHSGFVEATRTWLAQEGVDADIRCAPLNASVKGWPGRWYDIGNLPDQIDLLIIDGPPWSVHPFVRGAAECLFDRLTPGGMVLLDDAARPGERIVAQRWRANHKDMSFERVSGSTKGTLIGRKGDAKPLAARNQAANDNAASARWRRIAAATGIFAAGWMAHAAVGDFTGTAHAASIVEEAHEAYAASRARQQMASQVESSTLDRSEIRAKTGLDYPALPDAWIVSDAQLYPSDLGNSLMISVTSPQGEEMSLFAANAETAGGELPVMEHRDGTPVVYWEEGPMAYALMGEMKAERLLEIAATLAAQEDAG